MLTAPGQAAAPRGRGGRPKGTPNRKTDTTGRTLGLNAQRLLDLRRQHDLTQTEMADLLGVIMNTVSRWERGVDQPSNVFVRLAEVLLEGRKKRRKP